MVAIIPEITPDPEVETILEPALELALATTLELAIMLDRVVIRLRLYIKY